MCMLSHFHRVRLFCNPMDCSPQASLYMGSSRQEYWSGLPSPSPGDLPDPGIKTVFPVSPALQVDSLATEPPWKPRKVPSTLQFQVMFSLHCIQETGFLIHPGRSHCSHNNKCLLPTSCLMHPCLCSSLTQATFIFNVTFQVILYLICISEVQIFKILDRP